MESKEWYQDSKMLKKQTKMDTEMNYKETNTKMFSEKFYDQKCKFWIKDTISI
jgi:hypothetical protein